jgi:5-methylthioadenosine/S-adenosylhomocysteine deaminase
MLAMPGLINTHAHVPMVIFRGLAEDVSLERWFNEYMWPLESNLQEEDVYWGMLLGLAEMIEAGVTSVADHYFHMDQAAKAVEEAGTRAALSWAVFGDQGEAMLGRTAQFVERWAGAGGGRITTWLAPHAPYTCDDDFLRASAARARDLAVGIHIHVAETAEQTQASLEKRGLTPIRVLEETGVLELPTILAHAVGATADDIQLLADYPAGVAHAPKTYLKLAMGTAPVVAFRKAGVPVGLATDGAVSNNTLDVWESMRLMAMTQKQAQASPKAMTIPQVLHIATRGSAQVIGLPDQIGAVEPGYLADLILVDMSGPHVQPLHSITASLVYATRASDVHTVIVDGKVIMRDRQLLTLNKSEIVKQVNHSMQRLARRVPNKRIQVYNP